MEKESKENNRIAKAKHSLLYFTIKYLFRDQKILSSHLSGKLPTNEEITTAVTKYLKLEDSWFRENAIELRKRFEEAQPHLNSGAESLRSHIQDVYRDAMLYYLSKFDALPEELVYRQHQKEYVEVLRCFRFALIARLRRLRHTDHLGPFGDKLLDFLDPTKRKKPYRRGRQSVEATDYWPFYIRYETPRKLCKPDVVFFITHLAFMPVTYPLQWRAMSSVATLSSHKWTTEFQRTKTSITKDIDDANADLEVVEREAFTVLINQIFCILEYLYLADRQLDLRCFLRHLPPIPDKLPPSAVNQRQPKIESKAKQDEEIKKTRRKQAKLKAEQRLSRSTIGEGSVPAVNTNDFRRPTSSNIGSLSALQQNDQLHRPETVDGLLDPSAYPPIPASLGYNILPSTLQHPSTGTFNDWTGDVYSLSHTTLAAVDPNPSNSADPFQDPLYDGYDFQLGEPIVGFPQFDPRAQAWTQYGGSGGDLHNPSTNQQSAKHFW